MDGHDYFVDYVGVDYRQETKVSQRLCSNMFLFGASDSTQWTTIQGGGEIPSKIRQSNRFRPDEERE